MAVTYPVNTATNTTTISGISLNAGDRVLLNGQTMVAGNGVYTTTISPNTNTFTWINPSTVTDAVSIQYVEDGFKPKRPRLIPSADYSSPAGRYYEYWKLGYEFGSQNKNRPRQYRDGHQDHMDYAFAQGYREGKEYLKMRKALGG